MSWAWFGGAAEAAQQATPPLLANGSFEADTTGWTNAGLGWDSATLTRTTDRATDGAYSLRITFPTSSSGFAGALYLATGLTIGVEYAFSVDVYVPANGPAIQAELHYGEAGSITQTTGVWQRLVVGFTATATSHYVGVRNAVSGSYSNGQTVDIDNARLAVAQVTSVTQPSETDSGLALGRQKRLTTGIVTESDATFTASRRKSKAVGLVTETDTPLALQTSIQRNVGIVSETDTPLSATRQKRRTLGFASETDTSTGAVGGGGTPALRSSSIASATQTTGKTIAVPTGTTTDDITVVWCTSWDNTTPATPTISGGNGAWSAPFIDQTYTTDVGVERVTAWWKRATAGDSGNYTVSHAGSVWKELLAASISGVPSDVTNPIEDFDWASSSAGQTAFPAVSVTVAAENSVLLWMGDTYNGDSDTPPTDWTEQQDAANLSSLAVRTPTAAGTYSTSGGTGSHGTASYGSATLIAVSGGAAATPAVGRQKRLTTGQAAEADAPLPLQQAIRQSVGLVTETDATFTATRRKQLALGIVSETDATFTASRRKSKAVTQASEADSGLTATRQKRRGTGGNPLSLSFLGYDSKQGDTSSTTYTFTGKTLGAEDPDRVIVVTVGWYAGTYSSKVIEATINGVAATVDVSQKPGVGGVAIVHAKVPTGTTGDIAITFDSNFWSDTFNIGWYRIVGGDVSVHASTWAADPASASIAAVAGGVVIGMAMGASGGSGQTATWTGLTKDYNYNTLGSGSSASKVITADETLSVSVSWTGTPASKNLALLSLRGVSVVAEADSALPVGRRHSFTLGQPSETDEGLAVTLPSQIEQNVGLVTETDSTFSASRQKRRTTGVAEETDSGFTASRRKSKAVTQAAETDSGLAATRSRSRALGLSSETDSGLTASRRKSKTLTQPSETDSGLAATRRKSKATTLASETDSGLTTSRRKQQTLNQSSETNSGLAASRRKQKAVTQAAETDAGFAAGRRKQQNLGIAAETDEGLHATVYDPGVTEVPVGLASEADAPLSVSRQKRRATGLPSETDTGQAATRSRRRATGLPSETDTGQVASRRKAKTTTLASEADSGLAAGRRKAQAVTQAAETDSGLTATRRRQRTLGQASETDTAFPATVPSGTPLGQVVEAQTAQALTRVRVVPLGQVVEAQTAQPATRVRTRSTGFAAEVETLLALTAARGYVLAQVVETDTAGTFDIARTRPLAQAVEADSALYIDWYRVGVSEIRQAVEGDTATPLGKLKFRPFGQVLDTELAGQVLPRKGGALGEAVEVDTALPLIPMRARTLGQVRDVELVDALRLPGHLGDPDVDGEVWRRVIARAAHRRPQPEDPQRRPALAAPRR